MFLDEPSGATSRFGSGLQGLPNVILTPHIGGSTEEAQEDIGQFVAEKLLDYVAAGSNLPVGQPAERRAAARAGRARAGAHPPQHPRRAGHHQAIFAEHRINIEGQSLGTRGEVGYVITDIATDYTAEMLARLRHLDETIRLRTTRPS